MTSSTYHPKVMKSDILFTENARRTLKVSNRQQRIQRMHEKKVNVLLVDDEKEFCARLADFLSSQSSLFNICAASAYDEALKIAGLQAKHIWHCCVIDYLLGAHCGLELLDNRHFSSFAVIISGHSSFGFASEIFSKGITDIFDKDAAFFSPGAKFFIRLCKICSLSFLFRGIHSDYRILFQPLMNRHIVNARQWAEAAGVTDRYIRKICKLHTGLTPGYAIPYYYAIERLLRGHARDENGAFEDSCICFVAENIDAVYAPLYLR